MSRMTKATLPVADLQETFFVRTKLDHGRVEYFQKLYEAGAEVPPIKVVRGTNDIIDGRHRKHALLALHITETECILREPAPLEDLLVEALSDNSGGALPPTASDIKHVIKQLLELGVTRGRIANKVEALTSFPRKFILRFIDDVQSDIAHARLRKAVRLVLEDDATLASAAKECEVDLATLRKELNRGKDSETKSDYDQRQTIAAITSRFKSLSLVNGNVVSKLIERYEAGEVSEAQVVEVLEKISGNIKRMQHSHDDWRTRFEKLSGRDMTKKKRKSRRSASESTASATLEKMGL